MRSRMVLLVMPLLSLLGVALSAPPAMASPGDSGVLLYGGEGNRLRRYDIDTIGSGALLEETLIERASAPGGSRDINGMICPIPDGSGRFVAGEDTGQPSPPAGWGVFEADGTQVGKLTSTYFVSGAEPFGCAFTKEGILFTSEVGNQAGGAFNGQLIMWFPPYDRYPGEPGSYPNDQPSDHFCKIATNLGTAGGVAIDDLGRVYVAASRQLSIYRFSPPFPTGADVAGGCGALDGLGSPMADAVQSELFASPGSLGIGLRTWSGLAMAPNGNLWAASNLTGHIAEFDLEGQIVRDILVPEMTLPPVPTGNPQGIAVGPDGTLYYADLDLEGELPNVGPGPNGKVRRITFDEEGNPNPPEIVRENLSFPDGVAVIAGNLQPKNDWPSYAGGPRRLFFNPDEIEITRDNVGELVSRWSFPTDAIITASPVVAAVDVPGEGVVQVVYVQSWGTDYDDSAGGAVGTVYAVRLREGTELWRFETDFQPGASFPGAGSAHVEEVDGRATVFIGSGEHLYALDAVTGAELWRFAAGTGCIDEFGQPPGLCAFDSERNEIETSPMLADGKLFFGMDVNDSTRGKGGFYAVDASDGRMSWYFDLETGATCVPDALDEIRAFDGYHTAEELGLPEGFLASRSGCDFDRARTGCGNVWSSPAVDHGRELVFFASSNCDTDDLPQTPQPGPEMPPYDAALVALDFDGFPVWRWRPRDVDTNDLAFGATANLFTIDFMEASRDVVGIGNKDGTYYVLDREGLNQVTGVSWDDPDPRALPYWEANLVPGGAIGGIIGTAAVDEEAGRIYVSTAPGQFSNQPPNPPQRPTIHALDMNTGSVLWDDLNGVAFASYASVSAIPSVVFGGQVPFSDVLAWDAYPEGVDASLLGFVRPSSPQNVTGQASAPAIVDGILVVGGGIGTLTGDPQATSDWAANTDASISAWCVPGTTGCAACGDGSTDFDEECDDGNADDGDGCWSTCEEEASLQLSGTAEGGAVHLIVDGVQLSITTLPGDTAADIAWGIGDAIAADPRLASSGVAAKVSGERLQTNGTLTGVVIADAGLGSEMSDPIEWGSSPVGYMQFEVTDPTRREINENPSCSDDPSEEPGRTLPIDIWYPAEPEAWQGPEPLEVASYPLNIASPIAFRDSPVDASSARPLVIFSHGSGGLATQSTTLVESLASHGFIVAAPTHVGNTTSGPRACIQQALLDRSPDVSFVIDELLARNADPEDDFFGVIDASRIGVAGHSLGGFTAISVVSGFQGIPADDRVKAVVGIAPATSSISEQEHANVTVPTLLLTGTRDGLIQAHDRTLRLIQSQSVHSVYVVGATHTHFANICDIANQVINQFNLPPEDWFDFELPPQFGGGFPFRALIQPYAVTCGPEAFPLDEALDLQNLYAVSFFRRYLLGQEEYAPFLDPAYAEEEMLPITTQIPVALEIVEDDLVVLEPSPHSVTWIDPATGTWQVMSRFNVGWGPNFLEPVALVVADPETVYVADEGLPGIVQVTPEWGDRKVVASDEVGQGPSLDGLRALALGADGTIYALLESEVVGIDPATGDRSALVDPGEGPTFVNPVDIVREPSPGRDLLVLDAGARAVIAIQPATGARSVRISNDAGASFSMPTGIAVQDGRMLVVDRALQALFVVEEGVPSLLSDAAHGTGPAFSIPTDVVVTSSGAIRVVDEGLDAIIAVDPATGDRSIVVSPELTGSGSYMSGSGSWMTGSGSYMGGSGSFMPRALAVVIPEPAMLARLLTAIAAIAMLRLGRSRHE